jgi:hypothetical protein
MNGVRWAGSVSHELQLLGIVVLLEVVDFPAELQGLTGLHHLVQLLQVSLAYALSTAKDLTLCVKVLIHGL